MPVQQSAFAFLHFLIEESHIVRKPSTKNPDFDINIEPAGINDQGKKTFQLNLNIFLKDKLSDCEISIKAVGLFRFKSKVNEKDLPTYFCVNAPAIIYPYVRSYIAALTALSGMDVVNIPVMAMAGLGDAVKNNIRVVEKAQK